MPDIEVMTEVGRIVWGHPMRMTQRTDDDGKPVFKADGSPDMQISFGLALPKATFGAVSAAMSAAAAGVPGAGGSDFAWKFKDGDTAQDRNGKFFRDMPGRAGCYILAISTGVRELSQVFRRLGPDQYQPMNENEVKCGDFIRTKLKIVGHGPDPKKRASKPGLYLNPQGSEFVGYGEAISSGPDAASMFGGAPAPVLPPGASATPVASQGFNPPGAPGNPSQAPAAVPQSPPGMQQPMSSPPGAPAPSFAPAAAPGAPMPAASPVPPTAFPGNNAPAPVPHPQFVQNVMPPGAPQPAPPQYQPTPAPAPAPAPAAIPGGNGQQPVAFHPQTGRPIFAYVPDATGQQWPVYGYNPDGSPIFQ